MTDGVEDLLTDAVNVPVDVEDEEREGDAVPLLVGGALGVSVDESVMVGVTEGDTVLVAAIEPEALAVADTLPEALTLIEGVAAELGVAIGVIDIVGV